jgi:beta-ketoacyl-acyl-carrier-protein synthase II
LHRVVVTGLGAVTPVGNCLDDTWSSLLAGRSGIGTISQFDASDLGVRIGGEVKDFSVNGTIGPKELRHMDRSTQFGVVATREAIADAGLEITPENSDEVGVYYGSAAGGINSLLEQERIRVERGPDRVSHMFLPYFLVDTTSGVLAMQLGASGPNVAIVSACATGAQAIGEASEAVRRGDASVVIAGGTEAPLLPVIVAGFVNMRALAANNDDPPRASRPFDLDRSGFVLAEGAATVVLETLEHARSRGARIYAEVAGYGSSNDAFHMVAPRDQGLGAAQCMRLALRKASLPPEAIDYINAHGTSTPLNDKYETEAIKRVFDDQAYRLAVSSTKSMVGHMMGAAGAIESIVCVKAIHDGPIPPTINYDTPDPDCDLDYTPNVARTRDVRVAMTNSFGLGGHNTSVIFKKFEL